MLSKRWFAPLIVLVIVGVLLLEMPSLLAIRWELRESLRFSIYFYLVAAIAFNLTVWAVLRCYDVIGGIHFSGSRERKSFYERVQEDPRALADYFGKRLLAVVLGNALVAGYVFASVRL
jgi:hypothetical protein